ncbi:hypothetical protein LTR17_016408 [Elasticomyces elasticus]|nr:hypothetical protein LTR17_016408 [Elasticomyces elasticus]
MNIPTPFWRTQPGALDNHRTTADLPTSADVIVIGAGHAAASFVTHLLSLGGANPPSVLVLEERQLCSGATGRNGGHCKPDHHKQIANLARRYGIAAAAEVADLELANFEALKHYIETEQVDCDMVITRAMDVTMTDTLSKQDLDGYNLLLQSGVAAASNCEYTGKLDAERAYKVSGIKGAKSCFSYPAAHLWPYKLVHHMFAQAIAQGLNLQTETKVTHIVKADDLSGSWLVHTPRGVVRGQKVIVLTNAYTSSVLPEYEGKIIPYRAICARIVPETTAPPLENTYALRFANWDHDYLIPRSDGSIVVGGARSAFFQDSSEWYERRDDDSIIEPARHYFDGFMQQHFEGWENVRTSVAQLWTGIMGYSADSLPRIGAVPRRPGVFIMAGFTGHGMAQIFSCAKGLAEMVTNGTTYEQTDLPRLFEETEARLASQENMVCTSYLAATQQSKL